MDCHLPHQWQTSFIARSTLRATVSQRRGGVACSYSPNIQGSIRALTDASGAVTDTYTYTAFGELLDRTGTTVNPYLYTGQQSDDLTGLYSLRARYYDPAVGRFLSRDILSASLGRSNELNRYTYVAGNPINYIDPLGYQYLAEQGLSIPKYVPVVVALSLTAGTLYVNYANIMYLLNDIGDLLDRVLRFEDDEESDDAAEVGTTDSTADKELDANTQKKIRSLEKRIAEHEQKLDDYKADPDAYDNQGILRNAPSEEVRRRIIEGRIRHLEKEINTWKEEISRLRGK